MADNMEQNTLTMSLDREKSHSTTHSLINQDFPLFAQPTITQNNKQGRPGLQGYITETHRVHDINSY